MKSQKQHLPTPVFQALGKGTGQPLQKDQNSSQGSGGSSNTDSPLTNKAIVQSIIAPSTNSLGSGSFLSAGGSGTANQVSGGGGAGFSTFSEAHQAKKNSAVKAQQPKRGFIQVQDFDEQLDTQLIKEYLLPYLKDLYKDLALRSIAPQAIKEQKVDKVTFIQYCNLPGIMSDRLLKIFEGESEGIVHESNFVSNLTRIFVSDLDTRMRLTFNVYDFDSDGLISKEDVKTVLYYLPFYRENQESGAYNQDQSSNVLQKPQLNNHNQSISSGGCSPTNIGGLIGNGYGTSGSSFGMMSGSGSQSPISKFGNPANINNGNQCQSTGTSPTQKKPPQIKLKRTSVNFFNQQQKGGLSQTFDDSSPVHVRGRLSMGMPQSFPESEGLYAVEEGRHLDHKEKMADQESISLYVEKIFSEFPESTTLNFEQYCHINNTVTSEMFFSLMALLHQRLPCAQNIFRLKRVFRAQHQIVNQNNNVDFYSSTSIVSTSSKSPSPIRTIASPRMLKGLTLFKCRVQDSPSGINKHISSSTNDDIEEEEDIETFEPLPHTTAISKNLEGVSNNGLHNIVTSAAVSSNPRRQLINSIRRNSVGGDDGAPAQQAQNVTQQVPSGFSRQQFLSVKSREDNNQNRSRLEKTSGGPNILSEDGSFSSHNQQYQSQPRPQILHEYQQESGQQNGNSSQLRGSAINKNYSVRRNLKVSARQGQDAGAMQKDQQTFNLQLIGMKAGAGVVGAGIHSGTGSMGDTQYGMNSFSGVNPQTGTFTLQHNSMPSSPSHQQRCETFSRFMKFREGQRQANPQMQNGTRLPSRQINIPNESTGVVGLPKLPQATQENLNQTQKFGGNGIFSQSHSPPRKSWKNSTTETVQLNLIPCSKEGKKPANAFQQSSAFQKRYSQHSVTYDERPIIVDDFSPTRPYDKYDPSILEGECYLLTKLERFKKHWLVLLGNELYCYRASDDPQHIFMHSLAGTFVQELAEEKLPSTYQHAQNSVWPIKVIFMPQKFRLLYFKTQKEQQSWLIRLQEVTAQSNLQDFYTVEHVIGKGQFGQVKMAYHTATNQKVAVKIMAKASMKPVEAHQTKREIEVMKMSKHPNIVRLQDVFEDSENFYLVLEHMGGGDLFDYLKSRMFRLPEERAKEIIHQMTLALAFLHSFGVVHRDIKLENVMMSDTTDQAIPKLADFGLAKMIGPTERADEPFGTLGYAAPEVLKKEPYGSGCDLWSLGCISYALLCGGLPFDHESQRETAKLTLAGRLTFDQPAWNYVSETAKDFIRQLINKDAEARLTAAQALNHPWFKTMRAQIQNSINLPVGGK